MNKNIVRKFISVNSMAIIKLKVVNMGIREKTLVVRNIIK
jgi:hypothetical protein